MPAEIEVRRVVPTDWPTLRSPSASGWPTLWPRRMPCGSSGRCGGPRGAGSLRLLVHESNDRAAAAYSWLGFLPTGHREPYPLDVTTQEVELALPLR